MATPGYLRNAPIKEALVDLRIATTTAPGSQAFEPLKKEFPGWKWEERHQFQGQINAQVGAPPTVTAKDMGFHGFFLKNNDESRIIQFRADGFTINQLAGYTTADDLFAEAFHAWDAYVSVVRPTAVVRVALRYINALQLRFGPGDQFERYLTAPAVMPPNTPQGVSQFLVRTVTAVEEPIAATAVVTQQLEATTADVASFVLDIDAFKLTPEGLSSERAILEPLLQNLRSIKNSLFYAFVTDEALEPYK